MDLDAPLSRSDPREAPLRVHGGDDAAAPLSRACGPLRVVDFRRRGPLENAGSSQAKKPDSFVPAVKPERRGYDRLWNWPLRPPCAVENF